MRKIGWGLVGGGRGSQIGPIHRLGALIDGKYDFLAGALDEKPNEAKKFGLELGLEDNRSYENWQEMLYQETRREDRLGLITVATPNFTHFEIAKAFVEAGFNVLCEKPMTMTISEAEDLYEAVLRNGTIFAVNYGYSGFSLVREMRNMIKTGVLGKVRLVKAEFAHGHHGDATNVDNPRVRWRYDPAQAGVSAVMADCGIHALHMSCFITGEEITELSADFVSTVKGRELEDDAMINFRLTSGTVGRLWTSAIAVGRQHGFTIQVFGEKGGLHWTQEHPNQLYYTPVDGRTHIIQRGESSLSDAAKDANRTTIGHSEGMPLAFANIYRDLAEAISLRNSGVVCRKKLLYPDAEDGLRSVLAVHMAKSSASEGGVWKSMIPWTKKLIKLQEQHYSV